MTERIERNKLLDTRRLLAGGLFIFSNLGGMYASARYNNLNDLSGIAAAAALTVTSAMTARQIGYNIAKQQENNTLLNQERDVKKKVSEIPAILTGGGFIMAIAAGQQFLSVGSRFNEPKAVVIGISLIEAGNILAAINGYCTRKMEKNDKINVR